MRAFCNLPWSRSRMFVSFLASNSSEKIFLLTPCSDTKKISLSQISPRDLSLSLYVTILRKASSSLIPSFRDFPMSLRLLFLRRVPVSHSLWDDDKQEGGRETLHTLQLEYSENCLWIFIFSLPPSWLDDSIVVQNPKKRGWHNRWWEKNNKSVYSH